jgi:C4-dicarboxylate-specific signal transduction histidine kinase
MEAKQRKLILLLKKVRIEKNLSYQDIVDRCESIEKPVSLTTVKRLFAPGSEDQQFRYTSIQPVVDVLLGVEYQQEEEDSESESDALRSVVEIKNHLIEQLESGIRDREATIQRTREAADERIAQQDRIISHLKEEVDSLRADKREMEVRLHQAERASRLRTIALSIVIPLLIIALVMLVV